MECNEQPTLSLSARGYRHDTVTNSTAESFRHGSGFPVRFDRADAATDLPRQRKQEAEKEEVAVYLNKHTAYR